MFKSFITALIAAFTLQSTTLQASVQTDAFSVSYRAYTYAINHRITDKSIYVFIDFTKPSTEKRLYVVDNGNIIYSTWVTHGISSGNGSYVTSFSNIPNSKASSIGVSQVLSYYQGEHGKSARLQGLDQGFNDNMFRREVVVHAANYIGYGKTGHSWGCFAVPQDQLYTVLRYLTPGTIIVAYYPDSTWLNHSKFLH